jgi:hypothetical protein
MIFSRRQALTGGLALGVTTGLSAIGRPNRAFAEGASDRKYLFVISAFGGASIIDSFLPIAASTSKNAATLTTFDDALVERVGDLRCVAPLRQEAASDPQRPPLRFSQREFLEQHGSDVAVLTLENSSVSHPTAQARAMTGGGSANRGRTILETAADTHGSNLPLPVINMMSRGFATPGQDPSLPAALRQVSVIDPKGFALGTHSSRGIVRGIDERLVAKARLAREKAEAASLFSQRHGTSTSLQRWAELRARGQGVEAADLVQKLMLVGMPGVPASPDIERVKNFLPSLEFDVMQAEAALAYLLVRNGVSCAVGIGSLSVATRELVDGVLTPSVYPTEGFDNSHNAHRVAQSVCWARTLRVADGLIRLLKSTEDPTRPGTTMWSHSLVYFTTDFGREKVRAPNATVFGTGHHLNNGCIIASPLVKGGRVYGGVDPDTALTYGFDLRTGEPDVRKKMNEEQVYGAVAHALGASFPGRADMPALVKST